MRARAGLCVLAVLAAVLGTVSVGSVATAATSPAVTAVTPAAGTTAGGTTVTVTGQNFSRVTAVTFGTVAATNVLVVSPTKLTATSPPEAAGVTDVRVTAGGIRTAVTTKDHFTFGVPPALSSVAPSTGVMAGGGTVTVTGTGFTGATAVLFGSTAGRTVVVASATKLTVVAPAHAPGRVDLTVVAPWGTSPVTAADGFTFIDPTPPGPVSAVVATPGTTTITLAWTNPLSPDFTGVLIRRAIGTTAPATASAGTLVANTGPTTRSVIDNTVTSGTTYSYSLFAHDEVPNYSSAAKAHVSTLLPAGSISGTATTAGGAALASVRVQAFSSTGAVAGTTATAGDGSYTLANLPSGAKYAVCFSTGPEFSAQCYRGTGWNGLSPVPVAATRVAVNPGATTPGVSVALLSTRGGITGTVTAAAGGTPLVGVTVTINGSTGTTLASSTTATDGTYTLAGVPAGTGYTVCFTDSPEYTSQCSPGGTPVTVSGGATTPGINAALVSTRGSITGTVTATADGTHKIDLENDS